MARTYFRFFAHLDWQLAASTVLLLIFGFVALASVTVAKSPPDWQTFIHQLLYLGIGGALFIFAVLIDYRILRAYSTLVYAFAAVLLIAVLIFGKTINSTTGWFVIGGISFQPVEIVKVLWVVAFSAYLARYARAFSQWRHLAISGGFASVLILLVLKQPDLGSALVLGGIYLSLLFMANVRWHQIAILLTLLVVVGGLTYSFFLQGYQKDRIRVLFQPNLDPLGSGYNVKQAIIAVGSGKLFGRGFGQGTQSQLNFLPEQQTDFIFAVLAEEFGFLGVVLVLSCYALVLSRSLAIGRQSRDDFGAFVTAGFSAGFAIQLFINVGMNMGLMPVTGIPLPFVSAGGSSLVASLLAIGIVQSVAVRRRHIS